MRRKLKKRSAEEKERILQDIEKPGVISGCRKHEMYATTYYNWLDRHKVTRLILKLIDDYLIPNAVEPKQVDVIIRSDNGSQFIAEQDKTLLKQCHLKSNYIPPATPQMNGHIEAFHSTVQRLVCNKYRFKTLRSAIDIFTRFFFTYNHTRIMEAILNKSPVQFQEFWNHGGIEIMKRSGKNTFYFKEGGMMSMSSSIEDF